MTIFPPIVIEVTISLGPSVNLRKRARTRASEYDLHNFCTCDEDHPAKKVASWPMHPRRCVYRRIVEGRERRARRRAMKHG